MIRLLRANTYRFLRTYSNYIVLAALLIFGITGAASGDISTRHKLYDMANNGFGLWNFQHLYDMFEAQSFDEFIELLYLRQFHQVFPAVADESIPFLSLIIPSLIICRDCNNRSLQQDVLRTSRTKAVFSRIIQVYLLTLVFCWVILVYMLAFYTTWQSYPVSIMLRNFALASVNVVSLSSFTCLIAVIVRRPIVNTAVSFALFLIIGKISYRTGLPLFPTIVNYSNSHLLAVPGLTGELPWRLIFSLVYFAVCTALTAIASRRVDL